MNTSKSLNPTNSKTLFEQACRLQKDEQLSAAIDAFEQLLKMDPEHAQGWLQMGRTLHRLGDEESAYEAYQTAAIVDPGLVAAHDNIGVLLVQQKRFDDACLVFQQAVEIAPKFGSAYANLCHCLTELNKLGEAIEAGKLAVQHSPKLARAHNNLGVALMREDRLAEAEPYFDNAIELDPGYGLAYCNKGTVLEKLYRYEEAGHALQRGIELAPEFKRVYLNSAWLCICRQDWQKSVDFSKLLIEKISLDPASIDLKNDKSSDRKVSAQHSREGLLKAKQCLDQLGIPFFLSYGTLLGCEREGDFISYDSDIDLGIWNDVDRKALVKEFTDQGFELRLRHDRNTEGAFEKRLAETINLPFYLNNTVVIDLYLHYRDGETVLSGFELGGKPLLYAVSDFELKKTNFLGEEFLIPAKPSIYLTECYGDWRQPDPFFETSLDSPNIVGGFPPHARAFAYYQAGRQLFDGNFDKGMKLLSKIIDKESGDEFLKNSLDKIQKRILAE